MELIRGSTIAYRRALDIALLCLRDIWLTNLFTRMAPKILHPDVENIQRGLRGILCLSYENVPCQAPYPSIDHIHRGYFSFTKPSQSHASALPKLR